MVCALYGCFDDVIELHRMNEQHRKHYLDWGRPFQHMVRGAVGVAEGNIFHLWHGKVCDRQFRERYPGLSTFQFDPHEDIIKEDGGPLRWNTTKYEKHEYVREFFSSRREDG
jgi:hypothetical protein